MTLYIIQYKKSETWFNYKDDAGFTIELLSLAAALTIARDLAAKAGMGSETIIGNWQILDSNGQIHDL